MSVHYLFKHRRKDEKIFWKLYLLWNDRLAGFKVFGIMAGIWFLLDAIMEYRAYDWRQGTLSVLVGVWSLYQSVRGIKREQLRHMKKIAGEIRPRLFQNRVTSYAFSEEGVVCATDDCEANFSWSGIFRWGIFGHLIYLITETEQYYYVDDRHLTAKELAELKKLLKNVRRDEAPEMEEAGDKPELPEEGIRYERRYDPEEGERVVCWVLGKREIGKEILRMRLKNFLRGVLFLAVSLTGFFFAGDDLVGILFLMLSIWEFIRGLFGKIMLRRRWRREEEIMLKNSPVHGYVFRDSGIGVICEHGRIQYLWSAFDCWEVLGQFIHIEGRTHLFLNQNRMEEGQAEEVQQLLSEHLGPARMPGADGQGKG